MTPAWQRVSVIGVGLIGGSLARAVREAGLAAEVVGWSRRPQSRDLAMERGLVHRVEAEPEDAVRGAELIVLSAPLASSVALAARLAPTSAPGAILTDVGSVKRAVVAALEAAWPDATRVVGAHPIAGSERSGAAAAEPDLFHDSHCILTPTSRTDPQAVATVRALWQGVGAQVHEMPPAEHDALLARLSHAPHLLAYALMHAVQDWPGAEEGLAYAGGGFRDTTRIAGSSPDLWTEIVLENAGAVLEALREFGTALDEFRDAVAQRDAAGLRRLMAVAAAARRALDEESS
jgi:prephenate dehydrogenase